MKHLLRAALLRATLTPLLTVIVAAAPAWGQATSTTVAHSGDAKTTSTAGSPAAGHQPSAEALKHARAGFDWEKKQEYQYALYEYQAALKADSLYPYPVERIGGIYQTIKNDKMAIAYYDQAIKLDSNFDVYNFFNLGLAFRIVEKHDSAVIALKEFLRRIEPVNQYDSTQMRDADWWIKFNLGCIVEKAKPKNTDDPEPIKELNAPYDDFGPTVTADGQTLYFTSRRPGTNSKQTIETNDFGDDLFVSHRDSLGHWMKPTALQQPINSVDDEGAATVSADGQSLFFSLCRRPDGIGDCDIYHSELVGDVWTAPRNFGRPLNSESWDAQPTVTADGSTMYFSSKRRGSIDGSEDIYSSHRSPGGTWSTPMNIGAPVNTRFSEQSPFISADGRTLYFSSNGHPGYGNFDLFMSRMLDDGTWSEPVNLGRPINSYGDDKFLTIPARGDKVIYSSQRANARGDLDLYEAKLPPQFRPGPLTLLAGTVYDKKTHKPIGATIDVNDLKADQKVATYHSNKVTGKFYITLGTGKTYGITAVADGYIHYSDNYTMPDTIPYRELTHDLPLEPLPVAYANNDGATDGNAQPAGNGGMSGGMSGGKTGGERGNSNVGKPEGGKGTAGRGTDGNGSNGKGGNATNGQAGGPGGDMASSGANGGTKGNGSDGHGGKQTPGNSGASNGGAGSGATKTGAKNPAGGAITGVTAGQTETGVSEPIELHNIFFDFNKAELRPESHTELHYVADMLTKNPIFRIEIGGHTDSVGSASYNERLSLARANAVKAYLVKSGVAASRLLTKGFGASQPKESNATEEGRQRNRRTEFRFVAMEIKKKHPAQDKPKSGSKPATTPAQKQG